jgi:hypothetical protein
VELVEAVFHKTEDKMVNVADILSGKEFNVADILAGSDVLAGKEFGKIGSKELARRISSGGSENPQMNLSSASQVNLSGSSQMNPRGLQQMNSRGLQQMNTGFTDNPHLQMNSISGTSSQYYYLPQYLPQVSTNRSTNRTPTAGSPTAGLFGIRDFRSVLNANNDANNTDSGGNSGGNYNTNNTDNNSVNLNSVNLNSVNLGPRSKSAGNLLGDAYTGGTNTGGMNTVGTNANVQNQSQNQSQYLPGFGMSPGGSNTSGNTSGNTSIISRDSSSIYNINKNLDPKNQNLNLQQQCQQPPKVPTSALHSWILVLPQILARLRSPCSTLRKQVFQLLKTLAVHFPQELLI